ncbi:hypothetical protein NQ774_09810 [Ochrobactrum sp. BD61]
MQSVIFSYFSEMVRFSFRHYGKSGLQMTSSAITFFCGSALYRHCIFAIEGHFLYQALLAAVIEGQDDALPQK